MGAWTRQPGSSAGPRLGPSGAISQSLAGRIAILHLLPLSFDELSRFGPRSDLWRVVWEGGYPRIHDRGLAPGHWLADYVATYVQRGVRQVLNVSDLDAFTAFVRLAAGRTGQEVNLSTLGADAGVSHNTARSWLSVLETSFLVFKLPPWVRNPRKRVIKAPKLHFVDTGLACSLLGIRSPDQLRTHPLRGALFESWVAFAQDGPTLKCPHYWSRTRASQSTIAEALSPTPRCRVRSSRGRVPRG